MFLLHNDVAKIGIIDYLCNYYDRISHTNMTSLSQSQSGIYYACLDLDENSGNYQVPLLWKLPDSIDVDRLAGAIGKLVAAHPYILSHIVEKDGEPCMEQGAYNPLEMVEADSIDAVLPGLGEIMPLPECRQLVRFTIYRTPAGNWLYFNIHHIIFDGTSLNVMLEDLRAAYAGLDLETESSNPGHTAAQEQQLRESTEFKGQMDWYLKEFSECQDLDCAPVPSAMDRDDSGPGLVERNFTIPVKGNTLKAVCAKYGVKESVVFMGAWARMLGDFSASEKVYYSTIFHGRDSLNASSIGMYVRTLPVYTEMKSDTPTGQWLCAMRDQISACRRNAAVSFGDLHQELGLKGDIMFAYHGRIAVAGSFPLFLDGSTIWGQDLRKARPGLALDGQLFSTPGQDGDMASVYNRDQADPAGDYTLRMSWNSELYSTAMVESMVSSFAAIVNSMEKAHAIQDLAAASQEQTSWLDSLNPASGSFDAGSTHVLEMFETNAAKSPSALCCVSGETSLTFGQVKRLADMLAVAIRQNLDGEAAAQGTMPVVSYICPRNELMMLFPLAIAKAGCTYQPLDSSYPKDRLEYMMKDSGAALLLCPERFLECAGDYTGKVLEINGIEDIEKAGAQYSGTWTMPVVKAHDTLLLLYTSGTTGMPKGVRMTYGNLQSFCKAHCKLVELDENSRQTGYASYGFDAFMMEMWTVLWSGASLHVIDEERRLDLVAIHDFIEENHITHAFMTTQVATQLAINFPETKSLKVLMTGGEKLVSLDPPQYRMYNMYGPTESTAYVTWQLVTKNERNIPIGRSTAPTRLYVVNKNGRRVPMGALGELWVAGAQVANGYLNLPDKTAAVFIDNPFTDEPQYRNVYRTGDIVRYREDGLVEFVGRRDGQVKIRGFRVELKEIEQVIRQFPGIKEVTVQAFDLEAGGKAIAAYVTSDSKIEVKELNAFIGGLKPAYMVPAVTMQLDAIPLNVNGKVDKRRLPAPDMNSVESCEQDMPAAPLNRLEQELADIVGQLTGMKSFSIVQPLTYVGLTSISSIRLATVLYKKYGVTVSNRQISTASLQDIENIILESLLNGGAQVQQAAGQSQTSVEAAASGQPEPQEGRTSRLEAPLTNAQLGVWLECLKDPESTVYNIPQVVTFPDSVTPEQLQKAVLKVIGAHQVMLARIDPSQDPAVQTIDGSVSATVELSDRSAEELRRDFVRPFDLEHGPLFRAVVCGHTLLFDVHHLIMDGGSISVFMHQVCDALEGRDVSSEDYTYFDFARDEKKVDLTAASEYFDSQLLTVDEPAAFPADLHGNEQEGRPRDMEIEVDHAMVSDFARSLGVTPAAVYLAAVQYVAARYANMRDVCVCTVSSGRGNVRISGTVGMFVNTLALVSHIQDISVASYIRSVADNLNRAVENENFPFARIKDKYGISPEIVFVYQLGLIDPFLVGGQPVQIEELELGAPKFKTSMLVEERHGSTCLVCQFNDSLYSGDMIRRMLDSLKTVISNFAACPDQGVQTVSIVSDSQKKELEGMNSGPVCPMPMRLFHGGIERWVQSQPDRMAIMAADACMTYREFDLTANRIANALIKRGLKKSDVVVLLLPRRSAVLCAVLGVMKAGGVFTCADPEYPTERIQLIAQDSGAPFVVTTANLLGNYPGRGIDIEELLAETCDSHPDVEVLPSDLAYMIYTSGSTGRPKGVKVSHANITTSITVCPENEYYPMVSRCERICSVFTISFDAFIMEYGLSLFGGRTFVFANEEQAKNPIELAALMRQRGCDSVGGTSSRLLQYLDLPEFVECLSRCKVVLQGGEKFQSQLLDRLRQLCPDADILNGYGPTEISISCNIANLRNSSWITVGKPQPNYTEWILDLDGNELPVGVSGELCVGGEGVTQGYNNLPDKTAERFIEYRGMRAFKTGDFARWHSDGNIEILGRSDGQVKLRGLRIELGEVETAILQVPGVKNVLVRICNIQGRDHLSAYFTADRPIDINEMKRSIGHTLTAYMVPSAYLQMDAFPITPNGKVDFRHLPQPCLAQAGGDYVAPKGQVEKFYADAFAAILELDRVGATDSFFELGGTSLVVMKLVIMAQKAGYRITYADVFQASTPRELARLAGSDAASDQNDPDFDIRDFDYSAIDGCLERNRLESFTADSSLRSLGSVLLTGSTGFLGIHIFRYLLDNCPDVTIHCMVRSKHGIPADERFRQMVYYYFERNIAGDMGRRIFVHDCDVTSKIAVDARIDTVINCAAIVKHFSKGTDIEDVNVGGVRNCIDFCLENNARLIQVSTYSVAGCSVNGEPAVKAFDESMLFLGQRIHNQYVHSKIMGERCILDAVATRGLDAKIMRVGNLSARSQDGEFQINVKANSFMGRLKIYGMLGALPYSAFDQPVEFSPIDETAAAICLLAQTNSACTVFHPYNSHFQMLGDVLGQMNVIGGNVQLVEDSRFVELLNEAKSDASRQEQLSAMLAYEDKAGNDFIQVIPASNGFTSQVLLRLGFRWSQTSWDYVDQFLKQIAGLSFFE